MSVSRCSCQWQALASCKSKYLWASPEAKPRAPSPVQPVAAKVHCSVTCNLLLYRSLLLAACNPPAIACKSPAFRFTCFRQPSLYIIHPGVMNEPEQCIICLEPLPRASTSTSPLPSPALSSAVNAGHNEATAATTNTTDTTDTDTTHLTASAAAPDSTSAVPAAAAAAPEPNHLDIVASLDGCEHVIHDACIRSWAQKTNTCPICRTPFHFVRVYNGVDGTCNTTQTPDSSSSCSVSAPTRQPE